MRATQGTARREDAQVDPRLKQRIPVERNLHKLMIEGFDYLAKKQGLKSGKGLMYMVLSQYLSANLPEDFCVNPVNEKERKNRAARPPRLD
ncbi:MAG: hypothetical protein ONB46_19175 [candidate division KSB1 bacterium]|nr:hypothetical protein [candidate division KSB1 bacterium]MDZ7368023.1 hypothetical protein [candidate division KSB1 bacterium]MDZ7405646.1 hypothetical protein [candidate division KSB1 bacterium]